MIAMRAGCPKALNTRDFLFCSVVNSVDLVMPIKKDISQYYDINQLVLIKATIFCKFTSKFKTHKP